MLNYSPARHDTVMSSESTGYCTSSQWNNLLPIGDAIKDLLNDDRESLEKRGGQNLVHKV